MILFIFLEVLLICSFYLSCRALNQKQATVTPIGLTVYAWYIYLLIFYGPTSAFAVLGPEYVESAANRPWLLSHEHITDTIVLALIPFLLPHLLTLAILFFNQSTLTRLLLYQLRPAFHNTSNLLFGIVGTIFQLLALFLISDTWRTQPFSDYSPFFKIIGLSVVVLSISPQLALAFYTYYTCQEQGSVRPRSFAAIFMTSSLIGFFCFVSFSLRTSLILLCAIVIFIVCHSLLHLRKRLMLFIFILLAYITYSLATLPYRVHPLDSGRTLTDKINASFIYDISYRSGFATESVIIASKGCLDQKDTSLIDTILPELVRGIPSFLRQAVVDNLAISPKFEDQIRECYSSYDLNRFGFDLFDVKSEYFLGASINPYLASLLSTVFWIFLALSLFSLIAFSFSKGYSIFTILLSPFLASYVLSTSPGDLVVLFKVTTLFLLIVLIFRKTHATLFSP